MADFTVRIELRGANWETYTKLHEKMESIGFYRKIVGDDRVTYQLPDGEYVGSSVKSIIDLRIQVHAIASTLNIDPHVLVTQSQNWSWVLPKA
ncbi:hypothetical protein ID10_08825 [Pantoea agglomerans]|uniref:hypothetical protein n=1 Tax=Enterobacter agglomerans TaxID=549 RepID=UPI00050EDD2A|nr:hypothetical protein [Pantoea agglomerans]KGD79790.1 hypothetical protein ID10_08825 [Pantoea agglomerans]